MSCPEHSSDWDCAGCVKVRSEKLEKENAELREAYRKLELMYAEYLQSEHSGTIEEALEFIREEQGE